jgi:hypothetical protein
MSDLFVELLKTGEVYKARVKANGEPAIVNNPVGGAGVMLIFKASAAVSG